MRESLQSKLRIYNTASRDVEEFRPIAPPRVGMYTCGMTVYYFAHIGHLRSYTTSDVLRRTLEYAGYEVRHVMNVTDVGHMTSDADEGEDKLEVGAKREGKSPWEIARTYEGQFFRSIEEGNILRPHVICRATEHMDAQIGLVRRIEERGYTYRTKVGVIFDTARFPDYAKFARLNLEGQDAGARVAVDEERRQPHDFALWVTNQPNHIMQWNSPWGRGFPGWHIECSAMSMHYLGDELDIHTGGIDHIPVHHTNEIAQAEAATGKRFVRYWVHTAFLNIEGQKMSKSLGNLYTVDDLKERGYSPLSLRYFLLGSSYRKSLNFTWEALDGAQRALVRLWDLCAQLPPPGGALLEEYLAPFEDAIADDLNTSLALSVLLQMMRSQGAPDRKAATAFLMDRVLGLDLQNARTRLSDAWLYQGIKPEMELRAGELAAERQRMRLEKRYDEADRLRGEILAMGFYVEDTPEGPRVRPAFMDERETGQR